MLIDEKEKEQIRKEAKEILDKFSLALKNIKAEESFIEREEDKRKEKEGREPETEKSEFRKIMFENAPQRNEDFIIAEKKTW